MGEGSKIEWTEHTFNVAIGCEAVSEACKHCYAEEIAKRRGWATWGAEKAGGSRMVLSAAYWKQPLTWNRKAKEAMQPARVFCSSLADVFEDHPTVAAQRARLWPLIEQTPWLRWLLLTKRPQNILKMGRPEYVMGWPSNVWLGCTVENQKRADERLPALLANLATVHFVSCEPLLGPLDLRPWMPHPADADIPWTAGYNDAGSSRVGWVIAGGESGTHARPYHSEWAERLRDQCGAARVPFFWKQHGEWALARDYEGPQRPEDSVRRVWVREDGQTSDERLLHADLLLRWGKKNAGRTLDGRTWSEVPPLWP